MKNLILSNVLPIEGYVLEIDGKIESKYGNFKEALKAGLELKKRFRIARSRCTTQTNKRQQMCNQKRKQKLH